MSILQSLLNKQVQLPASTVNVTLLAFAAKRHAAVLGTQQPLLSIDISCSHGTQQQTHYKQGWRSNDGTGRQTDIIQPFHRPCST